MRETQLGLQDFQPIRPSFHKTEVDRLLNRYGTHQSYESLSGNIVTVLPTCFVPLTYLEKKDWKIITGMGHFRGVYSVDTLLDGTKPKIVVKSPERIFTKDETLLSHKYPWWGGSRSTQKRTIEIVGNPVVEEQAIWEAIVLLELHKHGIRAELPQALIENRGGNIELVVNEIKVAWGAIRTGERSSTTSLLQEQTGLQPEDYQSYNILEDEEGHKWIIDVNRWTWPPYTDNFRSRLIQAISQVEERY